MPSSSTDRRKHPRYGVVGRLWASLEVVDALPVVNVSHGGACVRSPRTLQVEATNPARLALAGGVLSFHVRVRHATAQASERDEPPGYLLGLEFIGVSPSDAEEIVRALGPDLPES